MAEFQADVHALTIEPHPNADRLDLAAVGGYRCVVGKDQFKDGDLAAYIPEGAICPDWLISDLGLTGKLAGPKANRVKAMRLRGVLSEGLVYPVSEGRIRGRTVQVGDVVTDLLEIEKHVPPIPVCMQGVVEPATGMTIHYDVEAYKRHPDVLREGEMVRMTEKLHGTWCCLGRHPDHGPVVSSKGLSDRGVAFRLADASNEGNLYVKAFRAHEANMEGLLREVGEPAYLLGEVFGRGVQDLHYGRQAPDFAPFDLYVGHPRKGRYLAAEEFSALMAKHGFTPPPTAYEGPFSVERLLKEAEGESLLGGGHMREGVVVRPLAERDDPTVGRVLLKCVSGAYLTREGGTEHN